MIAKATALLWAAHESYNNSDATVRMPWAHHGITSFYWLLELCHGVFHGMMRHIICVMSWRVATCVKPWHDASQHLRHVMARHNMCQAMA